MGRRWHVRSRCGYRHHGWLGSLDTNGTASYRFFLTLKRACWFRFVQSYRATSPVAHATFYSEMTDHRYLSADRMVQQTHFADGTTVTVNFSAQAFKLTDGRTVGPLSADVTPRPND